MARFSLRHAATPTRTCRAPDAARAPQAGEDVKAATAQALHTVDECNETIKALTTALDDATSRGSTRLAEKLAAGVKEAEAQLEALMDGNMFMVSHKRAATDVVGDNGDIEGMASYSKLMKTASGLRATPAPAVDAARAAAVTALGKRAANTCVTAETLVKVITPYVAVDAKNLAATGTTIRGAVRAAALTHASGAVKDMADMPGDAGAKLQLAFDAVAQVTDKLTRVRACDGRLRALPRFQPDAIHVRERRRRRTRPSRTPTSPWRT